MARDHPGVRLATFNVCNGSDGAGTPVDLERLVASCRALDADLLALQEVARDARRSGRTDQAAVIAERLGMTHVFGPGKRIGCGTRGNALLVRGTLTDVELLTLTGHLRLGRRDRRGVIVARASVAGLAVSVAVTHLSIAVLDNVPQERRVLDALAERPPPRLLLGDLNRRTAWVRGPASARGLELLDDDTPTYPRRRPRVRIDHVATAGLMTSAPAVVDAGISDHRALTVEVRDPNVVAPNPH
jgi:endonuclease/exonuclease/phosphatase family metal-dependent hydrolase